MIHSTYVAAYLVSVSSSRTESMSAVLYFLNSKDSNDLVGFSRRGTAGNIGLSPDNPVHSLFTFSIALGLVPQSADAVTYMYVCIYRYIPS